MRYLHRVFILSLLCMAATRLPVHAGCQMIEYADHVELNCSDVRQSIQAGSDTGPDPVHAYPESVTSAPPGSGTPASAENSQQETARRIANSPRHRRQYAADVMEAARTIRSRNIANGAP